MWQIDRLQTYTRSHSDQRLQRQFIRQGDTPIPMAGQLGMMRIDGRLARLMPYLVLSATCDAGNHAGLGFGWYDLVIYRRI